MGILKTMDPATGQMVDADMTQIPSDKLTGLFDSISQQFVVILQSMAEIETEMTRRGMPLEIPPGVQDVLNVVSDMMMSHPTVGGVQ